MTLIAPESGEPLAHAIGEHVPARPITPDERERWHGDAAIRKLLNRAAARGIGDLGAAVESLRELEQRA